jgi:hypothetical protein
MRRIIFVSMGLFLASCAAPNGGGMAPDVAPAAVDAAPAAAPVFATELAGPETFLPPLPTAVVILKPDDMARNRAFCHAAMALPTVQQAEASSVVAPNVIHTRWLVQIGDIAASHAGDCDFLVGTYDYARAARLMASVRVTDGGFYGRGPYLLMIIPGRSGMAAAGLDGSAYSDQNMASFVSNWSQALAQTEARISAMPERPGLVRSVFDLAGAVLATMTGGAGGLIKGVFAGL